LQELPQRICSGIFGHALGFVLVRFWRWVDFI
jgi:hypothetical protein